MKENGDDDFCRYYSSNDTYAVMFMNKESLEIDAVKILFAKYGAIKEVQQKGSPTGLCLVKFAEKSSAIKCIEDVKGRWPITLSKFTRSHVKDDERERRDKKSGDKNGRRTGDSWGTLRLNEARNDKRGIRGSDDAAGNNVDMQLSNPKGHSSGESASSSSRPEESIISHDNEHNNEDTVKDLKFDDQKSLNPEESLQLIKTVKRPPKLVLRKPKIFTENIFYSISQGRVSPVALKKPWQEEPVEHVTAQEVIIGNIDLKCDEKFILDLFEDYEPLLVSSMKLDEKNSFQYCHVYFRTKGQAEAAETRWDNAEVRGRNIIVLRAETLDELIR